MIIETLTIAKAMNKPGVTNPIHRPYVISGPGFGGMKKRGFIEDVLIISPTSQK
jgi:hypothetical protein